MYYFPNDGGHNDYILSVTRALAGDVGGTICDGAPNSTGTGAVLFSIGTASIASNDLGLGSHSLPLNSFGFYITSRSYGFVANPAGSAGNLCIAGTPIGRYVGPGQIQSSGATGTMFLPVDWTAMPQPSGPVSANAGDAWFFQLWYRDSSPSGPTSNFSGALRVQAES